VEGLPLAPNSSRSHYSYYLLIDFIEDEEYMTQRPKIKRRRPIPDFEVNYTDDLQMPPAPKPFQRSPRAMNSHDDHEDLSAQKSDRHWHDGGASSAQVRQTVICLLLTILL